MLKAAELSKDFHSVASDVYRVKFGKKLVEVLDTFWIDGAPIRIIDGMIQIADLDIATKLFQTFGSLVTALKINFDSNNGNRIMNAVQLANRYASALQNMEMKMWQDSSLDEVQMPFETVENVTLNGIFDSSNQKLQLNEMFPKMRILSLKRAEMLDYSYLVHVYPHLEDVTVSFSTMNESNEMDIMQMVGLNPQIQTISLEYCSMRFLKFLSENMANLRQLSLKYFITANAETLEHISLKSVEYLSVINPLSNLPRNFMVERLQQLELAYTSDVQDMWLDFIKRHASLSKLSIANKRIRGEQLSTLAEYAPGLVEASICIASDLDAATIIHYLGGCSKLKTLALTCGETLSSAKLDVLSNRLEGEWKITNTSCGYLFERQAKCS